MPPAARRHPVATQVLAVAEARSGLLETARYFRACGAAADPIFFGAHRVPSGVMLSYDRYIQLLDQLDDLVVALQVRERDELDDGVRVSVDEMLSDLGFDRTALEAEIASEGNKAVQ